MGFPTRSSGFQSCESNATGFRSPTDSTFRLTNRSGVRIILVEANCVLRGRVSVQGGSLPRDAFIVVNVRLLNDGGDSNHGSPVDSKGEFSFENLAPGNYEVTASLAGPNQKRRVAATQTTSVMSGIPADVALTLDLKAKDEDK